MTRVLTFTCGVMLVAGALGAGAASAQAPPAKWVAPIKGVAELGFLAPKTEVKGSLVITTIQVKNLSAAPIAGLRAEEYWFDAAGSPVTGGTYRHKQLLQPGEVITVRLEIPKQPKMNRNTYQFSHANGTIKTKRLEKFS